MSIKSRFSVILALFVPDVVIQHHNRSVHWRTPQPWRDDSLTNLNHALRDAEPDRRNKARRQYFNLLRRGMSSDVAARMAITDSRA